MTRQSTRGSESMVAKGRLDKLVVLDLSQSGYPLTISSRDRVVLIGVEGSGAGERVQALLHLGYTRQGAGFIQRATRGTTDADGRQCLVT